MMAKQNNNFFVCVICLAHYFNPFLQEHHLSDPGGLADLRNQSLGHISFLWLWLPLPKFKFEDTLEPPHN